ncbi:methyltransferase domain-containing protein [Micromonospora sp. M12]
MYQVSEFHHIPKCLYLQRMHPKNSQRIPDLNARIQQRTVEIYDRNIQQNALAWSRRQGLLALDLGAAHNKPEGYLGLDYHDGSGVDMVCDITKGVDLPDSSVGVIRAADFLEHIPDKIALFNELYRLLAPNGMLLSLTPAPMAGAPTRIRRTWRSTTRTRSGISRTPTTPASYPRSNAGSRRRGW